MALLVSDPRTENFNKPPPPKKKWIQDYLEKECKNVKENKLENGEKPNKIGAKVQEVIDHFQDYIDETNKKNGKHSEPSSAAETKNMASMLSANNCGVKFNNSIKELARHVPTAVVGAPDMSKQEIGGVVQEVISQFLNGTLDDAGFRQSRKRSHRSAKPKERKLPVQQKGHELDEHSSSPKSIKLDAEPPLIKDENGVLNLSMPKTTARVTFSSKDDCYSTDSFHTSQASKSQEMKDLDVYARASQSIEVTSIPPYVIETEAPLPLSYSLVQSGLKKAVIYTSSLKHKSQALDGNIPPAARPAVIAHPAPQKLSVIMPVPVEKLIAPPPTNTSSYSMESILSKSPTPPNAFLQSQKSFIDLPLKKPELKTPNKSLKAKGPSPAKTVGSAKNPKEVKNQSASKVKDDGKKYSCREVHNRLEKNRRALLKKNFDELAVECELDPKKASNLTVIRSAYKYVMGLKRQERENEKELSNLVKEKIRKKQLLETLMREMPGVLPEES